MNMLKDSEGPRRGRLAAPGDSPRASRLASVAMIVASSLIGWAIILGVAWAIISLI